MINNVVFEGNLTKNPEIKFFPDGKKYAILNLANSKKYKKQNGEIAENTCFIEAKVFGKPVEIIEKFLEKGKRLIVQGELNLDRWEDNEKKTRSKHILIVDTFSIVTFKETKNKVELEDVYMPTMEVKNEDMPF